MFSAIFLVNVCSFIFLIKYILKKTFYRLNQHGRGGVRTKYIYLVSHKSVTKHCLIDRACLCIQCCSCYAGTNVQSYNFPIAYIFSHTGWHFLLSELLVKLNRKNDHSINYIFQNLFYCFNNCFGTFCLTTFVNQWWVVPHQKPLIHVSKWSFYFVE